MTLVPYALRQAFGERLLENIPLSRYTAARIGGPAGLLLEVNSAQELMQVVNLCWLSNYPLTLLGGGSNVLVSDAGIRGLVVINRAKHFRFEEDSGIPTLWAESGANFGLLARRAAQYGYAGLEWAVGIPGTLGGAVVGNAGAHGGDMAGNLVSAEILLRSSPIVDGVYQPQEWIVEQLGYGYRSSVLKRSPGAGVVLAARLRLQRSTPEAVKARMDELTAYRKKTQPPGASMGSMFKNPPGDFAGRLIEAAGLKGSRVGGVEISRLHANFFINHGDASAMDVYQLVQMARSKVEEKFGVHLELEIELLGEW